MELRCPSYEYVMDMTWAEFQIRAYGYRRMQQTEDLRAREVAWASLIGFHADPKKLPKSKNKYWQIGDAPTITEGMKERILKAREEYFKKKKELDGR